MKLVLIGRGDTGQELAPPVTKSYPLYANLHGLRAESVEFDAHDLAEMHKMSMSQLSRLFDLLDIVVR